MSSTGRNLPGAERHADDFYATPARVTEAILPHVDLGPYPIDPCAGEGAILRLLGCEPRGFEIDVGRASTATVAGCDVSCRDALDTKPWAHRGASPSSVIMNPPFKLAMPFVERALEETRGEVVVLLRLAFLESAARAAFHQENPADVFVLANRPSFVEHLKWRAKRCTFDVIAEFKPGKKPPRCELELNHAGDCRTLGTDSAAYAWLRFPEREKRGPDYPARVRVLGGAS